LEIESKYMVDAQHWLNKKYSNVKKKQSCSILNISNKNLEGSLRLKNFDKLEKLSCCYNQLANLEVSDCPNLERICCYKNQLKNLKINNCPRLKRLNCGFNELSELNLNGLEQLERLNCNDNRLKNLDYSSLNADRLIFLNVSDNSFNPSQDLCCFSKFVNLEILLIGSIDEERINEGKHNRFHGYLKPLENMNNLKLLDISNTDINTNEAIKILPNLEIYSSSKRKEKSEKRGAQEYLDKNYHEEQRKNIKKLDISGKCLEGFLDFKNFFNLEVLDCSDNQLTDLNISELNNLTELHCWGNKLINIDFLTRLPEPEKLISLDISDNDFYPYDLMNHLNKFTNLEELNIENNEFYGLKSLEKSLPKLRGKIVAYDTSRDIRREFLSDDKVESKICECWETMKQIEEINVKIWRKELNKQARRDEQRIEEQSKIIKECTSLILTHSSDDKNEYSAISKKSPEELRKIVEIKAGVHGEIKQFNYFSTWFNPNCAIIISSAISESLGYTVRLIIYEPAAKKAEEVLFIKRFPKSKIKNRYPSLEKAQEKARQIEQKLKSEHPISAISKKSLLFSDVIHKFSFSPDINPEEYLKPLDVVWRRMPMSFGSYHAAIYLGNGRVAHISVPETEEEKETNFFKSVVDKVDIITKISNAKDSSGARIDAWRKFLKGTKDDLIRHRPVIPFKKPKKIIEHIIKTVLSRYAKGEYDLFEKNCEHFATLCVCGIPFSEQADKLKFLYGDDDLVGVIKKNDETFEKFEMKRVLEIMRKNALQELKEDKSEIIKKNKLAEEGEKEINEILRLREKLIFDRGVSEKEIDRLCQIKTELTRIENYMENLDNLLQNQSNQPRLCIEITTNKK
jgi:Leucine-rich repeat (LRR) protein